MISWWMGLVLFCTLLAGCGGGKKAAVAPPPAPSLDFAQEEVVADKEESLAEQLSENRLEELLAKSGLHREDPILEEELKKWDQTLKIDVPVARNKQVKAYLVYFSTERKNVIRKYLARSSRYLPMIREVFQEHGLPEDLAYLAMIESGFNPHAYSHAHACGMWQFIQGTGRRYGLAIDKYVDERRDPVKSTHAAAKYLLDLYKQFGSWYLAAASYNCGENRVQREIDSGNHKNFWDLTANKCLPNETQNYVPQMIAATIIAKNPDKFGFKDVPYQPRLQYDTITVKEPVSLKAAAIACNVSAEEMEFLNPELRQGVSPPDQAHYVLKIPKNSQELFARNIGVAKIGEPAVASTSVGTSRSSSRSRYTKKETHQRRVARSTKKSSPRRTASSKKTHYRTAQTSSKTKASSRGKGSVQVASILAGGSAPRAAKVPRSSDKNQSARSSRSVKKSSKKKVSSRTQSREKKSSKVATSLKKSKVHIKRKPVQTAAKTRPNSS